MHKTLQTFVLVMSASVPLPAATPCESLSALKLTDTTITLAQTVTAGAFAPPVQISAPSPTNTPAEAFGYPTFKDLPAFCRVAAEIKPANDSDIKVEVWMPLSGWNGKFQGVGNGGWSGRIFYSPMGQALTHGYATASTNTGHDGAGTDASFAQGHPEKVTDFGYRAVHEMTVKAKAITAAFYGNAPRFSYWNGCSSGGRQGLVEAQRFPHDYDGIVVGAPANFWTHLMAGSLWVGLATLKDAASYIPKEKYPVIHNAVLDACDSLDGVKDGVLENPLRCHFDPKVLGCESADGPACLTAPQVEAARKIYAGPKNPRTGQQIYPGLEAGSELGWAALAGGPKPLAISDSHFKYLVFQDPNWDFRTLNFDSDVALADKQDNGVINATEPDLKQFLDHGGKLILYHGWNDQALAPQNTINYYNSIVTTMGGANKIQNAVRLFMVPGMNHCTAGDGPFRFNQISALEQWVEKGKAPDKIIASHPTPAGVDQTRPLCPYPQIAKYKETGSTDEAANFVCTLP